MNKISHSVSKIENLETVAENPCISGHKKKKSFNGSNMITQNRPQYAFPRASSVIFFMCVLCFSSSSIYEKIKPLLILTINVNSCGWVL